jgi:hypothetical protein
MMMATIITLPFLRCRHRLHPRLQPAALTGCLHYPIMTNLLFHPIGIFIILTNHLMEWMVVPSFRTVVSPPLYDITRHLTFLGGIMVVIGASSKVGVTVVLVPSSLPIVSVVRPSMQEIVIIWFPDRQMYPTVQILM